MSVAHHTLTLLTSETGVEQGEQVNSVLTTLLSQLALLSSSGSQVKGVHAVSSLSLNSSGVSNPSLLAGLHVAHLCHVGVSQLQDVRHSLLNHIGLVELQVGATSEELQDTILVLLCTRHLHHDAALTTQLLDVRLSHAELIDTSTNHCLGVVNSSLNLIVQGSHNFLVSALGVHLVAQLLCSEDSVQVTTTTELLPTLYEVGDEVRLIVLTIGLGSVEGFAIALVSVVLVASQEVNNVRY